MGTFPLHPKEPWAATRGICQPQGVFPSLHLSCLVSGGWKLWMFIECLLWTRHHRIALIGYKHLFFQADGATAMAVSVVGWLVLWGASAPGSTYTPPSPELGGVPRGAPKDYNSFWLCPLLGTPVTSTSGGHDWLLKLQVSPAPNFGFS